MRKVLIFVVAMGLTGCLQVSEQAKFYPGGAKACQYVKEQVPGLREDIDKVEVVREDSLLGDSWLAFDVVMFARAGSDFMMGNMSRKDYERVIDERRQVLMDVAMSWDYGTVVNDSLRGLEKYDGVWRKVYTVKVTMKSGVTKDFRVLMDNDGETPRMMEDEFTRNLEGYHDDIMRAEGWLR